MSKLIAAAVATQLGLIAAPGAQAAENWYLRSFGDSGGKGGVAAPLQYCLRGIAVAGGICGRAHYLEDRAERELKRQSQRRPASQRSDW